MVRFLKLCVCVVLLWLFGLLAQDGLCPNPRFSWSRRFVAAAGAAESSLIWCPSECFLSDVLSVLQLGGTQRCSVQFRFVFHQIVYWEEGVGNRKRKQNREKHDDDACSASAMRNEENGDEIEERVIKSDDFV